jgi:hypothetical protein
MMSDRPKKGIELNTVQLVSSMAAAVTGAVLTSYLGDGGTILGTAVGSGASTAGFAVYKHYLSRTKEKVTPVLVDHARQWTPTGTLDDDPHAARQAGVTRADATRADAARGSDATRADRPVGGNGNSPGYTAADWERARRTAPGWAEPTRAEPGLGPDVTRQDPYPGQTTRQDFGQPGPADGQTRQDFGQPRYIPHPAQPDDDRTRTAGYDGARYGTVRMGDGTVVNRGPGGPGPDGTGSGGAGDGRHGKPGGVRHFFADRPAWVWTVASAAVVFIVALIIITLFELGTGKPISDSVWSRSGTGTTLGGGSSKTSTTPSQSATPTQSPTAPSSVGATGSGSSNPTPGGTQPSPTISPSSVPTVGTTRGATAPASGGFGGNGGNGAGAGTAAPGQ